MDVRRKQNETIGSLLRRFSRLSQQTGIVKIAKITKHRKKKKSERQEKNRAIMREHLRALRFKLEKLGKYSEETFQEEKRKLKQRLNL